MAKTFSPTPPKSDVDVAFLRRYGVWFFSPSSERAARLLKHAKNVYVVAVGDRGSLGTLIDLLNVNPQEAIKEAMA